MASSNHVGRVATFRARKARPAKTQRKLRRNAAASLTERQKAVVMKQAREFLGKSIIFFIQHLVGRVPEGTL